MTQADHDARRDATPDVMTPSHVQQIRGYASVMRGLGKTGMADELDSLCDSHEALRRQVEADKHAAKDYVDACVEITRLRSRVVALEAERDAWNTRLHKLMDACGWDISFNIDRSIDAMVERLRAAARIGVSEP